MSFKCKSLGCDQSVTDPTQDFCTSCGYVHSILGTDETPADSEVIVVPLDTYAVHQAFNIQDPSGCLQRASRILLMSGQMNEETNTPKAEDIFEARNMLTRWLQLNEFELA